MDSTTTFLYPNGQSNLTIIYQELEHISYNLKKKSNPNNKTSLLFQLNLIIKLNFSKD